MDIREALDPERIIKNYDKLMDMMAEEMGLKVKFNPVLVDYAKTLGKTVYELTDAEKHEAVCNEMIRLKEEK